MGKIVLVAVALLPLVALGAEVEAPHAKVTYTGIDARQASALAETVSAARKVYAEELGFDMPETVVLDVKCAAAEPTRLYTDGQDHLFLSLPFKSRLAKPSQSAVYGVYGLCHEMGHMALYRTLKDRDWLSAAAEEGWGTYVGSLAVDRVFAAKGESVWPDPYDYREEGLARLDRALTEPAPSTAARGAAEWKKLVAIIGKKSLAPALKAWQAAGIDATKPGDAPLAALIQVKPDQQAALTEWWQAASPLLVEKRSAGVMPAEQLARQRVTGRPIKLALDDDNADGKKSIPGNGHARKFAAPPGDDWYLCAVSLFGARYGRREAPGTDFEIALCDDQLRPINSWKKPYALFDLGDPKWVRIELPPTRVPSKFYVCFTFNPSPTSGVNVSYDKSTKGNSLIGRPEKTGQPFTEGDWMIRVELDQAKDSNPLTSPMP